MRLYRRIYARGLQLLCSVVLWLPNRDIIIDTETIPCSIETNPERYCWIRQLDMVIYKLHIVLVVNDDLNKVFDRVMPFNMTLGDISKSHWNYKVNAWVVITFIVDDGMHYFFRSVFKYYLENEQSITLAHWSRVVYICVSNINTIGSNNGLSPDRCQAVIWSHAGIFLIGPLGTQFNEF